MKTYLQKTLTYARSPRANVIQSVPTQPRPTVPESGPASSEDRIYDWSRLQPAWRCPGTLRQDDRVHGQRSPRGVARIALVAEDES